MRYLPLGLLLLAACTGESPPPRPSVSAAPVSFRVVRQGAFRSCVEPPAAELVTSEDKLIDVFDRETECVPAADIELPDIDLSADSLLALWWKAAVCPERPVAVRGLARRGTTLVVSAAASPAACPRSTMTFETFLAVPRDVADATSVVLELSSEQIATLPLAG